MIKLSNVKAVDLSSVHDPPNRIALIGIELEGGWTKLPEIKEKLIRDGSVHFPGSNDEQEKIMWIQREFTRRYALTRPADGGHALETLIRAEWVAAHPPSKDKGPAHIGEIPSSPLGVEAWRSWLREAYPSHVNHTCGMHVHISFNSPLVYQRLMCPEYPKTVLEEFKKWGKEGMPWRIPADHPFWLRVGGEGKAGTPSEYCQPIFQAADQAKKVGPKEYDHYAPGHRYTVIHYAWGKTKTLECRLLPMFEDVGQAINAVQELIDITNGFLLATRKKEARTKVAVSSSGEEFNRRIEVRI